MSSKYEEHVQKMLERLSKETPSILYKYRSWTDPYHQKLITDKQLYFADPITLNDAWDGGNPVRWDLLTYEDCKELNKELIMGSDKLTIEALNEKAKEMIENKDGYYPGMKSKDLLPVYAGDDEIGIVALSA